MDGIKGIITVIGRNKNSKVLAHNFEGKRYDIGNKFGLLKANSLVLEMRRQERNY